MRKKIVQMMDDRRAAATNFHTGISASLALINRNYDTRAELRAIHISERR